MSLPRTALLAGAGALLCIAALGLVLCPKPLLYGDKTFSTAVTDREGRLMRLALADDERYRLQVALADISPEAVAATLSYEDQYFYQHPGVNPVAILRALWSTYVQRGRVLGASTITMQLARLRFGLNTRTMAGKLTQIGRALQLERHYTKDEILEAYLNLAPYGGNIEGMGTAALIYFDTPAAQLTTAQALALAVIPQNPVRRDPSSVDGYAQMNMARERLRGRWQQDHAMSTAALARFELPLMVRSPSALPFHAPHFSQATLMAAGAQRGMVRTTLDLDHQAILEQTIRRYVGREHRRGIRNASAMLVDHRTMELIASVGSADFFDDSIEGQVDGTRASRSPGSTLKPFVYGLAMDQGLIHPSSLLKDAPTRFAAYTPENFDRGFMGPINATEALIYSRNVPATQLLSQVGVETFHRFLSRAGVRGLKQPGHYGLALVLGGMELTMHDLVRQYAMLANGGVLKPLVSDRLAHREGSTFELLSAEASFLVLDMLRRNPRPGALRLAAHSPQMPVAWKTGTSYAFRDAWAVGVFGRYVLAVWVGNFNASSNPAFTGRTAAAPLFFEIIDTLSAHTEPLPLEHATAQSLNLTSVEVCADTGDLPGRYCPRTEHSWFIPGVSPIKVSNVHRAIKVNSSTGLRECDLTRPAITEVFEFWPSDILSLYRRAGRPVRQPPDWRAGCGQRHVTQPGMPPSIISPSNGVAYTMRINSTTPEQISLQAAVDGDSKALYWFVDDRFVGMADRDGALSWDAEPGRHRILAIDDMGRSDGVSIVVARAL